MNEQLPLLCAESSGVPMLLCPAELANYWEGINEPRNARTVKADFLLNTPDGPHVDYDRACDLASEYVNSISIGPGQALLFGDEIPSLYWLADKNFAGGYVITWLYLPEAKPDYQTLVALLPTNFFSDTGYSVACSSHGLLLFPATHSPMDGDYFESIKVALPVGVYAAAIGFHEAPNISLRIIRIQLRASSLP